MIYAIQNSKREIGSRTSLSLSLSLIYTYMYAYVSINLCSLTMLQ